MANNTDLNINNLSPHSDDDEDFVIPAAVTKQELTLSYEFSLVGSFLTTTVINFMAMKSTFVSYWRPPYGIEFTELGAHNYLFQFFHEVDVARVAEGGSYSLNNHQLVMHQLKDGDDLMTTSFLYLDIWIQVHDLLSGHVDGFCPQTF